VAENVPTTWMRGASADGVVVSEHEPGAPPLRRLQHLPLDYFVRHPMGAGPPPESRIGG
jgi:hypothetical protein